MDLRRLDRGDRQNLATARARAKTDAVVNAQCCATEQSRQTDVENKKNSSLQAHALYPHDLTPEITPREAPMCRSGVTEHKSTAKHWGLTHKDLS